MKRNIPHDPKNRVDMCFGHFKKQGLPPDSEEENFSAALRGNQMICIYQVLTGIDRPTALGDLLADIMHLCDRDPDLGTFEKGLGAGNWHYTESTKPVECDTAKVVKVKSTVGSKRRKR